jgi:hypothetical protein
MKFFRNHWYDIGGILGAIMLIAIVFFRPCFTNYQLLMWLSFIALTFHQAEEYRIAGTFPGMVNRVMFHSDIPDRYPLNSNTALIINVGMGWTLYLLAAIAGSKMIWLGMSSILVSLGNFMAHTFVFNIKGKTLYNAGLITSWLFFAPCVFFFFIIIHKENLVVIADYFIGIPLGIIINVLGVLKPITWFADQNTPYRFKNSQLLPCDRATS